MQSPRGPAGSSIASGWGAAHTACASGPSRAVTRSATPESSARFEAVVEPPPPRQSYNLTLGVLVLSALAYALSQTLVAPALPEIQRELHTTTTLVTFVLTGYLLSASVATPIVGRLGDMFG